MTVPSIPEIVPRRLLLATDLSARCDRALDRAAQLAEEWRADLLALNVLDPTASPDQALAWASGANDEALLQLARQQLGRDLSAVKVPVSLRIARSDDAAAAIREIAASTHSDLVVTGVARNETLGRFLLGSTVERLARTLPQPLLVVRNRAHAPYRKIVVATDFSESSRHALQAAARLFPRRKLILYHARATALAGLADPPPQSGASIAVEQDACTAFLAASGLSSEVNVHPVVERGAIEATLARYVRRHDIDVVVIGSHGRNGIMSLLLGSTAARLLDWLPCDVMVAREPQRIGQGSE
jgi:nucleotide-binding universal stress UspA family protein